MNLMLKVVRFQLKVFENFLQAIVKISDSSICTR